MRRGFFLPSVLVLATIVMLVAGILIDRTAHHLRTGAQGLSYARALDASQHGMRAAENWLLDMFAQNRVPALDPHSAAPMPERIAAVVGAEGVRWENPFADTDLRLFVADADYVTGSVSANDWNIPRIPVQDTGDGLCRYYYLRSSAGVEGEVRLVCEEVLAVRTSHAGELQGATRLFYRSSSERD